MNIQEQLENAWKNGFDCAIENAYSDEEDGSVWTLEGSERDVALNEFINTQALNNIV